MKQLNYMAKGMHPLNYASKLSKESTDLLFYLGVAKDKESVEAVIRSMEDIIERLKESLSNYA